MNAMMLEMIFLLNLKKAIALVPSLNKKMMMNLMQKNIFTATRMALEDVVFESPVHATGKKPQLNWTRLQKTGLSVAVQAFQKSKTA